MKHLIETMVKTQRVHSLIMIMKFFFKCHTGSILLREISIPFWTLRLSWDSEKWESQFIFTAVKTVQWSQAAGKAIVNLHSQICSGKQKIRCMVILIGVTKCPLAFHLNFIITCIWEYRQLSHLTKVSPTLQSDNSR